MVLRPTFLYAAALVLLSGCGGMAGLNGSSTYACKAPEGVRCDSLSGVYANAIAGNLPSQRQKSSRPNATAGEPIEEAARSQNFAPGAGQLPAAVALDPIRTEPKILRAWIAPYEDSDGDLVDQQFVYMPIDTGKWAVEHARRKIKDAFAPARPVQSAVSSPAVSATSSASASRLQADPNPSRDVAPGAAARTGAVRGEGAFVAPSTEGSQRRSPATESGSE